MIKPHLHLRLGDECTFSLATQMDGLGPQPFNTCVEAREVQLVFASSKT
jgi:hypothetical protein